MSSRISQAARRIEERMSEPLTVAALAQEFNLSPSRFAHLFREEFGVAPMRYVHVQRMLRARALLEGTFLTVREVMVQVGCGDPSHFARDFRRFHGLPPRDWRAAQRDLQPDDSRVPQPDHPKEEPPQRPRGP
jgi:AraC family transcriptional regulator of arabinose operon